MLDTSFRVRLRTESLTEIFFRDLEDMQKNKKGLDHMDEEGSAVILRPSISL